MSFLEALRDRNLALFLFGAANLLAAAIFLILSRFTDMQVMGVNAWYKPTKFALSIGIYAWTIGWYLAELELPRTTTVFNWLIIILLGLELIYIGIQAARGQLSHFNLSTPFYARMYNFMAIAATGISLLTGYLALLYFSKPLPHLPAYYLWAIRIGLILFVIFSLEGFVMGARLSHTIGGPDGGKGLPFLNWSRQFGDPRVAHFIGMHALQVIPLLAYYVLKNVRLTIGVGVLYSFLAVYVLVQALQGRPFVKG